MNPILTNRPQSGFPVSIATGLALETIFDPIQEVFDEARQVPDKPPPEAYTDYLINLSTVARNLVNSVPTKELDTVKQTDFVDVFLEEVLYLTTLFQMHGLPVQFYVHSYAYPRHTYKDKIRTATTALQTKQFGIVEACLKGLKHNNDVLHFDKSIRTYKDSSTLILTHMPWDLLSFGNFRKLDLLESHTGTIKTRSTFNTKYFKLGDKDMSFLPFMEYLLTTFGDHVLFKPSPIKDREQLYSDMIKKRVHPLMTEANFLFG